jgi:hypothetical protein
VETITTEEDSHKPVAVTGITLDYASLSLKVGDGMQLAAMVIPSNATNRAVVWISHEPSIATVDQNGYVECIAEGEAVIACMTVESAYTATCTVTVAAAESGGEEGGELEVTLSRISAAYSGGDVAVGTAVSDLTGIVVTAYYANGVTKPVTDYTISGTIAEGSNTITVSYGGKTATFTVVGVAKVPEKVQLSSLETTDGFIKADGTVASLTKTHHVTVPYTDGMQISTASNGSWDTATYPPVVVFDGGTYSAPAVTKADGTVSVGNAIVTQFTTTLQGYSADAIVYVSFMIGTDATIKDKMDKANIYYYIPGGAA